MRVRTILAVGLAVGLMMVMSIGMTVAQAADMASTPPEMVATYSTLADTILGAKNTETNLVRAILASNMAHAQVQLGRAQQAIKANDAKATQAALESLASSVALLGTEGDAAVAAIRKRLIEGGHHHHADGEAKGIYDEGFVVVTRVAKQAFLDSSRAIGQMARAPKAEALDAEWKKVQATFAGLSKTD